MNSTSSDQQLSSASASTGRQGNVSQTLRHESQVEKTSLVVLVSLYEKALATY